MGPCGPAQLAVEYSVAAGGLFVAACVTAELHAGIQTT